jgi:hypothetical protein
VLSQCSGSWGGLYRGPCGAAGREGVNWALQVKRRASSKSQKDGGEGGQRRSE